MTKAKNDVEEKTEGEAAITAPEPVVLAKDEHPSQGGSYVRQDDGTAVKQEG